MIKKETFTLRSDEVVPGFISAGEMSTSCLAARSFRSDRAMYPTSGMFMFGLPPGGDLNQPRGPVTSLKEEPLGARWMQQPDQTK